MQVWKKRVATLAVAAVAAAMLVPATPAVSADGDNGCWKFSRKDRKFKNLINAERLDSPLGLGKLKLDPELSRVAKKQTQKMIKENRLHHTDSDAFKRRVTNWVLLGENVGVGGTVDSLHTAFMNSPAHKANVLHTAFTNVGVFAKKDSSGKLWVTIQFESLKNPGTTLNMPKC